MGLENYKDYLATEHWKRIRQRVFAVKGSECVMCERKASTIHHRNYLRPTMAGLKLRALVPLCRGCHYQIEFNGHFKNTLAEANRKLKLGVIRKAERAAATEAHLDILAAEARKRSGVHFRSLAEIRGTKPRKAEQ